MLEDNDQKIAYFSMEIALSGDLPIYSGGLGVLSGDTLRSAADLEVPIVGVTLTYNAGYFYQQIAPNGSQVEKGMEWDFGADFIKLEKRVILELQDKKIKVEAWKYNIVGRTGHVIPVILLDTDLPENEPWQRNLTHMLYDADRFQRIVQEMILGICGYKMLEELGYDSITTYHLNEGHAAFLIFELIKKYKTIEEARKHCVFTTHTPVRAGLEEFSYDLVQDVFRDRLPDNIKDLAGTNDLNMTILALNGSKYVNAVSKKHAEISKKMFPNYSIDSITNGVHIGYWLSDYMKKFFDNELGLTWHHDITSLEEALQLDSFELWRVHLKAKRDLLNYERYHSWILFDKNHLTIGFARRMAEYKRPLLIFTDIERLAKIVKNKVQFIFSRGAFSADKTFSVQFKCPEFPSEKCSITT